MADKITQSSMNHQGILSQFIITILTDGNDLVNVLDYESSQVTESSVTVIDHQVVYAKPVEVCNDHYIKETADEQFSCRVETH